MLTRESGEFEGRSAHSAGVAPHQFEHGHVPFPVCTRADMGEACAPRLSVANEGNRAPDVAQRPQCEREVQHCPDARVDSEAERKIVVAPGLEQGQRTLDMLAALGDILRRTSG